MMMKKPAMAIVMAHKPDALTFKAPDGMDMDDKQPGDMIQAVVDLKIGPDGMLTLKKVNGMDIGGGDESAEGEQAPPSFADSVMGGPAPEES